jgi:hypothetical protein
MKCTLTNSAKQQKYSKGALHLTIEKQINLNR